MSTQQTNQTAGPSIVTEPRPPLEVRRLRPPVFIVVLLGAIVGALFGALIGTIYESNNPVAISTPFGGIGGTLLGLLAGVVFVVVGILLYGFIRSALSGAIVLGLFAMFAMALIGGLFGALVGLLAGVFLGALVGAVKASERWAVGKVTFPERSAPTPPLVATKGMIRPRQTPTREQQEHVTAGGSRTGPNGKLEPGQQLESMR